MPYGTHTTNPSLQAKVPYDPIKDYTPITLISKQYNALIIHPSIPAKSVKELIALARAAPKKLSYASSGAGAAGHLGAELLKQLAGVDMVHVPYKGAPPAMSDLLAGQVALTFATAPSAVPHVQTGHLRALGVSSATRIPALPKVPTIAEAGVPGYEAVGWNGLVGPSGMPPAIVDRLNAELVKIVRMPDTGKRLSDVGLDVRTSTAAEFAVFLKEEVVKWAKVVKDSGVRVD